MAIDIEIISAPSILGLTPSGVQHLGESLLKAGLAEKLSASHPVIQVPVLNDQYSKERDSETQCLNPGLLKTFSVGLGNAINDALGLERFPLVLGGDCSILLGIMPALKKKGIYGLIFLDAHADFYQPEKSTTGEVADMDLAIVTGRGPEILTNINGLRPYVEEENTVHVAQRDEEETKHYGSQDIRESGITCFSFAHMESKGIEIFLPELLQHIEQLSVDGFWIHFDTDVLADEVNPGVDYRLPGGLQPAQVEKIIGSLLATGKMTGISVTIFNPLLDSTGRIAALIAGLLGRALGSKH